MIWLRTNWRLHHIRCKIRSEIYEICMLLATGYPAEISDFYPRFFWLLRRCDSLRRIRMADSTDTCGRKPYPERKSCGLRKYPDTYGRGLKLSNLSAAGCNLRMLALRRSDWAQCASVLRSRTYSTRLSKSHCDEFWSQAGAGLLKVKKYSRLPITRTFKGNRKKVRVIGSSS